MTRLSTKEESLPNVTFDGLNLRYGENIAAGLQVSPVVDEERVYRMGRRLITPSRVNKIIECPACWPTRVHSEETERIREGREMHEIIARNPIFPGEENHKDELEAYYVQIGKRVAAYPEMTVRTEEAKLISLFPQGVEMAWERWEMGSRKGKPMRMNYGYCGNELTMMPRTDQVWQAGGRVKVQDLKLSGGKKGSNAVQLLTEALGYVQKGSKFPKMAVFNLKAGVEEQLVSKDSRATLWWYFQVMLWTHLAMVGGFRVPNPEHEHVRTTAKNLESRTRSSLYYEERIPEFRVNGSRVVLGDCLKRAGEAMKKLEDSVEMVRVAG